MTHAPFAARTPARLGSPRPLGRASEAGRYVDRLAERALSPHLSLSLTAPALAVDTGITFGEPFALALVGFAFALWAGIAALSHQSERAFSASIIYLLLGLVAAATLALLGAKPLDPVAEPSLLEHLSEVALIIAVFTTGLSLEADLRWRTWRKVAVLLAIVMPLTIAAIAL